MTYLFVTLRRLLVIVVCAIPFLSVIATSDAQSVDVDAQNWFFSKEQKQVEDVGLLKQQAESGKLLAQLHYAKYLFDHDKKSLAVLWLTEANNQGSPQAEYLLGKLYETGDGVAQDFEQSRYFFNKAAEQSYPPAQYILGKLLINSDFDDPGEDSISDKNVQKKMRKGVELLQKSAESGYAPSQYEMGLIALNGIVITKNPELAFAYFKSAADKGIAAAAYMTGTCYASGVGTQVNHELARQYLNKTIDLAGLHSDYGSNAELAIKKIGVPKK